MKVLYRFYSNILFIYFTAPYCFRFCQRLYYLYTYVLKYYYRMRSFISDIFIELKILYSEFFEAFGYIYGCLHRYIMCNNIIFCHVYTSQQYNR